MKARSNQRLAWTVFPRYSYRLDVLNRNARVGAWVRAHADLPTFSDRQALYRFVNETRFQGGAIDLLEFGVGGGRSLRWWSEVNASPDSRFVGFDTFEGIPEDWLPGFPKGSFSQQGKIPQFEDRRVSIQKGLFQDTLPRFLEKFPGRRNLVVHHDSDLYSSTLYCLTKMNDVCTPGTVLVFDEFTVPLEEFRAYEDYLQSYRRALRPIGTVLRFGIPDAVAFVYD
ncbi:MAG: class I SAM-dependent methyltransferase [Thermoplasmata archaeon]